MMVEAKAEHWVWVLGKELEGLEGGAMKGGTVDQPSIMFFLSDERRMLLSLKKEIYVQ